MSCRSHSHPRMNTPLTPHEFLTEFVGLARLAGIDQECTIDFSDELARRHTKDERAYADVDADELVFRFAPAVLELPLENVRGLIAHELGHVLCAGLPDGGTEADADAAAQRVLGVSVKYDCRWPGKGLQSLASTQR